MSPWAAPRACSRPGCAQLIYGRRGKCPDHGKRAWSHRESASARGYGYEWQKRRKEILERDRHVCGYCGAPATTVDHVTAKTDGGTDDPSNLISCCQRCQASKAGREGSRARRRA
jgi:5-methylcytosine-specific restriction protein A